MDPRKLFDALVARAGSLTQLAADLGEPITTVNNWRTRGVPSDRAVAIQRLYDIPVHKTRPNDWRKWWPEAKSAR